MLLKLALLFALTISFPHAYASKKNNKKVFGYNKRTQVTRTTSQPFSAIGEVGDFCTGTLIGKNFVLTAAHCLVDTRFMVWREGTSFSPGRNGNMSPLGTYEWKRLIVPEEYIEDNNKDFDFALIVLKENIGDVYGTMPIVDNPLDVERKVIANIIGYPGDKPPGSMWKVACEMLVENREKLYHLCDTYGGMSGSAIYTLNSQTKERSVIGVHTYGNSRFNGGVFINREVKSRIEGWMANPEADYPISISNPN